MLTNHGQRFDTIDEANVRGIINCNIMSMARMCHIVLPQMVRRKSGVIINIGSIASTLPTPLLTIYGATKVIPLSVLRFFITFHMTFWQAFVNKFSQDLAAEVRPLGVTVQTVHPGYVLTNMAPMEKSPLVGATPETYVAATLRTLGLEDRTGAYWAHKIQVLCNLYKVPLDWILCKFHFALTFVKWNNCLSFVTITVHLHNFDLVNFSSAYWMR